MARIFLFFGVNFLVVMTILMITKLVGVEEYNTKLLPFCFIWGSLGSLLLLYFSKTLAKWTKGIQLITINGPHKNLVQTVHRLSRRAGLCEMPEVGIYQDKTINAFAVGPSRNQALVAISSGLLAQMQDQEIEGILAHEVAHIANGDMVTMILNQGVLHSFTLFFFMNQNNQDKQSRRSSTPFIQKILINFGSLFFGILAVPAIAWFSRDREYRADLDAADLVGKEKIISALKALMLAYPQQSSISDYIYDPFKLMQITSKDRFIRVLSGHPAVVDRIEAVEKNAL